MKIILTIFAVLLLSGAAAGQDSVYVDLCGTLNLSWWDCPRIEFFGEPYPLVTSALFPNYTGFNNGDTVRFTGYIVPFEYNPICMMYTIAHSHTIKVCSCCEGQRGDADCDGTSGTIGDIFAVSEYLFVNGSICCFDATDVVVDGNIDIEDLALLTCWLFNAGCPISPGLCPGSSPAMQEKEVKR